MKKITFFILFLFALFPNLIWTQSNNYTLLEQSVTSGGVFDVNGNLLRTLWSNITQDTGTYDAPSWDGLDDNGVDVTSEATHFKIIANNIQVEWEGVIGNNSTNIVGTEIWRGQHFVNEGITIGNSLYTAYGANERDGSIGKMDFNESGLKKEIMYVPQVYPAFTHIAFDGVTLFFAGTTEWQGKRNLSYVSSSSINSIYNQSNWNTWSDGTTTDVFNATYPCADFMDHPSNPKVTGLAVQIGNENLFIARGIINSIRTINKVTGALKVENTSFVNPKLLKLDANGFLWFVHGETGSEILEKFIVNDITGEITTTGLSTGVFKNARCLTINNDSSEVLLGDANTISQVFSYSTTDLSQQWVLGRNESYQNDATVYNDKFLFSNYEDKEDRLGFLAFEPDGSLWINDFGNERLLKFDINRNYEDQVVWKSNNYHCQADPSNPTRLFADFKEYEIDYTLPIRESWKLIKNWGVLEKFDSEDVEIAGLFTVKHIETLSNGRTYGLVATKTGGSGILRFIEFVDGGTIRDTGVILNNPDRTTTMRPGGIIDRGNRNTGDWQFFTRQITGFDANNNPILSEELLEGSFLPNGDPPIPDFPVYFSKVSTNNVRALFTGTRQNENGKYHFAGFDINSNSIKFKTLKGQIFGFDDPYPLGQNIFDERELAGSSARGLDNMDDWFIWGYHGEFWQASQTNYWHMISDSGLFLKDFGTNGTSQQNYGETIVEMAGNAFSPSLVKYNGDVYLYHNDESWHGGLHRWKINNLESIKEYNLSIGGLLSNDNIGLDNRVVKLYPNPVGDYIKIKGASGASYVLHDQIGKRYKSGNIDTKMFSINISNLSSGFYIITIVQDGQINQEKIVIQ